ncbi:GTP 3',8-cyclase MoaA [Saccharospirillum salsuginis]|uniref:GTP 3',8-cyclase n=1 Tax=Saccharospirillum salsuginis TaxID=418750 RepID=A0A918N4G9_9GAMM|nr:GTP 3',8-cyclase MoaA [Saccharospirillum salsuginis]GGX38070.1 GTP 3',8-cyclase [Saccharospirillum salsuginis]
MLQDALGRRFYYLRLSITDVCNFRCTYCLPDGYQGKPDQSFLTLPEIRQTLRAFAVLGTEKVRLTGGEPGLRADLPEIIAEAAGTPGIRKVAITSNGYKLPQRIDRWREAGLNQLNLSIDSLDPRQFQAITGHDRLREVLDGMDRALELGVNTKVNAVLMRGLNDQLSEFLAWLKTIPVTLRFIEVMETGDHPTFFREHHMSGETVKERLLNEGWQPVIRTREAGPAQEFWHPDFAGRIGLIMPYSKDFCASCNRLRISSTGKLHLCLFSDHGLDVRQWMQPDVDNTELQNKLVELLRFKAPTHLLHEHNSGGTQNLSIIGG